MNSLYTFLVPDHHEITRIDQFLSKQVPAYSRTFFQKLITNKLVMINGRIIEKYSFLIKPQDSITVFEPEVPSAQHTTSPLLEAIKIIYTHEHFLILEKPAGLIVHKPSANSSTITLADWLVTRFEEIKQVGALDRPGIIHRLDKDTSGLIIIARTNHAHMHFNALFHDRLIKKTYLGIVNGHPNSSGIIDQSIRRHPVHKHKMSITNYHGRSAVTQYEVERYFQDAALIKAQPITGRTHQIRVHCASIGHSIIGDTVYGTNSPLIKRHALHAHALSFSFKDEQFDFISPLPHDMELLMQQLPASY